MSRSARGARASLLALTCLVLPAADAVAAARWVPAPRLLDVRYEGARRLGGVTADTTELVPLPWAVVVEGRRWTALEVGAGWVRFARQAPRPLGASSEATSREARALGPRVDVLSGPGVGTAGGGDLLALVASDGAAIRWVELVLPGGGTATVELLVDRLGTVTLQFLHVSAGTASAVAGGALRSSSPSVAGATAVRWAQELVASAPPTFPGDVPRPHADGPPPAGCDPVTESWCEVADGPGGATVFLQEGFDDGGAIGRGWTATDLWHEVSFATCVPGASADPGTSYYFGENATCSYLDNRFGSLTSPPVGPVTANTMLTFSLRLNKEDAGFPFPAPIDFAEVYINGVLVASFLNPGDPFAWFTVVPIPMSDPPNYDFSGQMVQIEFRFTSDFSVVDLGWFVDDVLLWDAFGPLDGCSINAGLGGRTPCDRRVADEWHFNEGAFCLGCTYTFYALVECGREMHLPMFDMEGADVQITNMITGQPVSLRCRNQTALADAGMGNYPVILQGDCCIDPGEEMWWGPPFDETDSSGMGRVAWGFPDCPNLEQYDRNGDGLTCDELPNCGGPLDLITPGEGQVMDCFISEESGLCGIYRLDITSGGFLWDLFANCDGADQPQFPIFYDCTEAWEAFNPLPELAVAEVQATSTCPNITVQVEVQNIGCADWDADVPVRIVSDCVPADSQDATIPGPVPAGGSVVWDIDFTSSCAPVQLEVFVDPDDVILECTESPTAAACRAEEGIDSLTASTCACAPDIIGPPTDQTICAGDSAMLDASGIGFDNCLDPEDYAWSAGGVPVGTGAMITVTPGTTTTYEVDVTCPTNAECSATDEVTVFVEQPPAFDVASAQDFAPCNLGITLEWDPATFFGPGAAGVYHVYRSTTSCADALAQPAVAADLAGIGWADTDTLAGTEYYYVVEAEDDRRPTTCTPIGPNGGAVTRICLGPILETAEPSFPAGVFATLRARHDGQQVTMLWDLARALLPDEHFHLLKAVDDPRNSFTLVNGEGDLARSHVETDTSSPRQFFDLRVANVCEQQSEDEFPAGFRP